MTIQETYNHYINTLNVENSDWYKSLQKYSNILQKIKEEAKLDRYKSYNDLNSHFRFLANEEKDDFLDRYLFRKNNGLSEIPQQLITKNRRHEILNQVKSSFSLLNNILKENDIEACQKLILEFIKQNKWSVANRFLRALFPNHFTSIDSDKHFKLLKKKLRTDFDIVINTRDVIDKNKFALSLIKFDDIYKAQIFFWMLKSNEIPSMENLPNNNTISTNQMEKKYPINQILYGPPGTGKTYKLLNDYYSRFEVHNKTVSKKEYEFDVISKLNWWQVFALVLLEMPNLAVPDIKKHRFVDYKLQVSNTKSLSQTVWGQLSAHTIINSDTVKYDRRTEPLIFDKSSNSIWKIVDSEKEQIEDLIEIYKGIKEYKEIRKTSSNHRFITFHQSFSYEDFIEGIKPIIDKELNNETSDLSYTIEKGIFYECCNEAAKLAGFLGLKDAIENYTQEKREQMFKIAPPYGLFIDEINRGNISQIFGELITLIEDNKRLGKSEIIVELPYSKDKFGVPPNLHIIGTMNTADRSIEALDTALRRRFCFEEMLPKTELLSPSAMYCRLLWDYENVEWKDSKFVEKENNLFLLLGVSQDFKDKRKDKWEQMKKDKPKKKNDYFNEFDYSGIDLQFLLKTINKRIEILLNRDHTIGHSYFMSVNSFADLQNTFKNNIIPLLQEYFYGDYEKIGMILGTGFFDDVENYDNKLFAKFPTQNYPEGGSFLRLKTIDENFNIIGAIETLLGNNSK